MPRAGACRTWTGTSEPLIAAGVSIPRPGKSAVSRTGRKAPRTGRGRSESSWRSIPCSRCRRTAAKPASRVRTTTKTATAVETTAPVKPASSATVEASTPATVATATVLGK